MSRNDRSSTCCTTRSTTAIRSAVVAKRTPISCRIASACRFSRPQVARRLATSISTTVARSDTCATWRSSARNRASAGPCAKGCRAQVVASSPNTVAARCRHWAVNSVSECNFFSGRVSTVACCRNFAIAVLDGARPCSAT